MGKVKQTACAAKHGKKQTNSKTANVGIT